MTPRLPDAFLGPPIAHRGLHDRPAGIIENSMPAINAAVAAGYGIEIDIQPDAHGAARVFHDYDLKRLTGAEGAIADIDDAGLATLRLTGSSAAIPLLTDVLAAVDGRVPLLVEIKDQDRRLGPGVGPLERAVAAALDGYAGPVAVMSFNPHSVAAFAAVAPAVPRGLVTERFIPEVWTDVPADRLAALARMEDADRLGISFISHDHRDLQSPEVARMKAAGHAILCWTVRSPAAEAAARQVAHNITFEKYRAPLTT